MTRTFNCSNKKHFVIVDPPSGQLIIVKNSQDLSVCPSCSFRYKKATCKCSYHLFVSQMIDWDTSV